MPRRVACRRCKRPSATSLCASCRGATYGSSEYRTNSTLVSIAAKGAIINGGTVRCVICDNPITLLTDVTVEHIRSVSQGGSNALDNLGPAHAKCNYAKRPAVP